MTIVSAILDSFQEYEGEHSLVLFASGCSLNCEGCYNKTEVLDPDRILKDDAISFIDKAINPMHTAVVLLGGEPCIHSDIIDVVKHIKDMGLKVKVYTNGMQPAIVYQIAKYIDAASIDIKCVRDTYEVLGIDISIEEYLRRFNDSCKYLIDKDVKLEFRTTKWKTIDKYHLDDIIKYVRDNYPNVKHIIQSDFNDYILTND